MIAFSIASSSAIELHQVIQKSIGRHQISAANIYIPQFQPDGIIFNSRSERRSSAFDTTYAYVMHTSMLDQLTPGS